MRENRLWATTIVVPVFNAPDSVRSCLASLDECYPSVRTVVVDDASDEVTKELLRSWEKGLQAPRMVIWRQYRGWFTRAVNQGLRDAMEHSEWVVTLNSDCVVGAGALEEMFAVWDVASALGTVGVVGSEGPQPPSHPRWDIRREPGYVTGHAYLLNSAIMRERGLRFPQAENEVGGFSAYDLVHINSDRALCYQMNRMGMLVVASYHSAIGHAGGASWSYRLNEVAAAGAEVMRREP
ncbi:MAG: glycosyltransferase family 2 protein [Patescibacteria group bacterium]|nr:glycosyltransferase family 2 protein [Patescibacteria group bacterium]